MKTHFFRTIALFILVSFCCSINAQQEDTLYIRRGENGKIAFARFAINKNSDRKMENDTIFLKSILQAKNEDQFRLKSTSTDKLGFTHRKFQQFHKGIKVESAEYLLHGRDGHIEVMNGDFFDVVIQNINPTINEQQALVKALEYVGAEKYYWEDPYTEDFLKQLQNNPLATYYPQGELVIVRSFSQESDSFLLSWKFSVSSLQPYNEQMIFVDAMNGEILRVVPLIINVNVPGNAETLYSGFSKYNLRFLSR